MGTRSKSDVFFPLTIYKAFNFYGLMVVWDESRSQRLGGLPVDITGLDPLPFLLNSSVLVKIAV
jgi:hypothetical protein